MDEIKISQQLDNDKKNISFNNQINNDSLGAYEERFELPIDLGKKDNKLIVKVPIIGSDYKDIHISIHNNILTIQKSHVDPKEEIGQLLQTRMLLGAVSQENFTYLSL